MLKNLNDFNIVVSRNGMFYDFKNKKIYNYIPKGYLVLDANCSDPTKCFSYIEIDKDFMYLYSGIYKELNTLEQKEIKYTHSYKISKKNEIVEQYHYNEEGAGSKSSTSYKNPHVVIYELINENGIEKIKEFFQTDYYLLSNKYYRTLNNLENINDFFNNNQNIDKKNPSPLAIELNNKVDSINFKIPKIKDNNKYLTKTQGKDLYQYGGFSYFKYKNKDYVCYRKFVWNTKEEEPKEIIRIFINNNKVIYCKKNTQNSFFVNSRFSSLLLAYNCFTENLNIEKCKNTKLEYIAELINSLNYYYKGIVMAFVLKNPLVEQIYKANYKNIFFNAILYYKYENSSNFYKYVFGVNPEERKGNLYNLLGINKYQLTKLNEYCSQRINSSIFSLMDYGTARSLDFPEIPVAEETKKEDTTVTLDAPLFIIGRIKKMLNMEDISSIDNDTFDKLVPFAGTTSLCTNAMCLFFKLFTINDFRKSYDFFSKEFFKSNGHNYSKLCLFSDYVSILMKLVKISSEYQYLVSFNFKTLEEFKNAHDLVAELYNTVSIEFNKKQFKKSVNKIKKYAYSNEKFCIVVPSEPNDLAKEGESLHHCVKSYIEKVSAGQTNIVFLRKNSEPDKSLYTIEVQKKEVIQVHGICNSNLTDPEAIEFLKDWAKTKKIALDLSKINIIR